MLNCVFFFVAMVQFQKRRICDCAEQSTLVIRSHYLEKSLNDFSSRLEKSLNLVKSLKLLNFSLGF